MLFYDEEEKAHFYIRQFSFNSKSPIIERVKYYSSVKGEKEEQANKLRLKNFFQKFILDYRMIGEIIFISKSTNDLGVSKRHDYSF